MAIDKRLSIQDIENLNFDQSLGKKYTEPLGFDGVNLQRLNADALQTKVTQSGSIYYIGIAAPGTTQATAKWQAQKIDITDPTNIVITWADSANFSQVATDLTALSYS